MKTKHIIIGLIILVGILFFTQNKEHAGSVPPPSTPSTPNLSNEAVQNIAKIYADTNNEAVFNNIKVTGNINVAGNTKLNGDVDIPKWRGMISMWSGDVTKIPLGWALCDGTNGTPDLRGRFILSHGKGDGLTERKITEKGGEENVTLSIEQIPSHRHNFGRDYWDGNLTRYKGVDLGNINNQYSNDLSGETSFTGGGKPHNNMPPFYVLAYIMKL
jgi:microcystin-dependent protein